MSECYKHTNTFENTKAPKSVYFLLNNWINRLYSFGEVLALTESHAKSTVENQSHFPI